MATLIAVYNRFQAKIQVDSNGCWLWTGSLSPNGYGRLSINNAPAYAHRWAYEYFREAILDGLVIDHLCRVRRCVNPAHMELVTRGENVLRGDGLSALEAKSLTCKNGHPWNKENTLVRPDGTRYCRACGRARERNRKARRNGNTHSSL